MCLIGHLSYSLLVEQLTLPQEGKSTSTFKTHGAVRHARSVEVFARCGWPFSRIISKPLRNIFSSKLQHTSLSCLAHKRIDPNISKYGDSLLVRSSTNPNSARVRDRGRIRIGDMVRNRDKLHV